MKKRVAEIFLDDNEGGTEITIDFADDLSLAEQLGYLEWAKSVILKAVEIDNALAEYNEDET